MQTYDVVLQMPGNKADAVPCERLQENVPASTDKLKEGSIEKAVLKIKKGSNERS